MKEGLCYNTFGFYVHIEDLVRPIQIVCYVTNINNVYNSVLQTNLCFSLFFPDISINHKCFYLQFTLMI